MTNRNPLSAKPTVAVAAATDALLQSRRSVTARRQRLSAARGVAGRAAAAFTLVELLVVIAITVILLGLLFGPIIQGFNFTRRARAIAQAQDAARFGLERMTRELSEATFVYSNLNSTITLPLEGPGIRRGITPWDTGTGITAAPTTWPRVAYGKIDFVAAATRTSGQTIDPTTGRPIGGGELRPFTRGTRVIRYFLGLRAPVTSTGAQQYYQNVYEFPRTDDGFNPVVLYRAEFDPNDPNLFNFGPDASGQSSYNSAAINSGGFNDPNFFYNSTAAGSTNRAGLVGNGKTYAENWRAIARPVLASQNTDLIAWNRNGQRQINNNEPFRSTVSFAPGTVANDTATPGFLSNASAENPSAIPTLYTAKYGQWSYPYRVTFLRGSTYYNPSTTRTPEPYGVLTMEVSLHPTLGTPILSFPVRTGSLGAAFNLSANVFASLSPTSNKLFVKTPQLTFVLDPDRGRIETGIPTVMGTAGAGANGGVPYVQSGGTIRPMRTSFVRINGVDYVNPLGPTNALENYGDLVPTEFRLITRAPEANTMVTNVNGVTKLAPTNQGIVAADLFTPNYFAPVGQRQAASGYPTASPIEIFGTERATGLARGILPVPGSEQVFGPDSSVTALLTTAAGDPPTLIPYSRVSALGTSLSAAGAPGSTPAKVAKDDPEQVPDTPTRYVDASAQAPRYFFAYDQYPTELTDKARAMLQFVRAEGQQYTIGDAAVDEIPGLPATRLTDGGVRSNRFNADFNDYEIRVSYLWQNNYSRDPVRNSRTYGNPLNARGIPLMVGSGQPEADVVRLDYSTRNLITLTLGARVYDTSSPTPQSVTISDKVQINNVGR